MKKCLLLTYGKNVVLKDAEVFGKYTWISHLSAITDIMGLVYFLLRNFRFNVSYVATNAIFSTPLLLYPFCSLFLPNSCVVRQCICTVSYILYWNFSVSIFLWGLSQNISPSVIFSNFFSASNLAVYTHMCALCESVFFLTVDYMWEMLLYIYVIISYQ
jgi:hypothetical protein